MTSRSRLALKGSAREVTEFLGVAINSILFQRGVYPPDDFKLVKKYGLNVLMTVDEEIKAYIKRIMSQISRWMAGDKVKKVVLAISESHSATVIEQWQFDVESSNQASNEQRNGDPAGQVEMSTGEIQNGIRALIRQVTASTTFLPELVGKHTFTVLVYASDDAEVPLEWVDSDARNVVGRSVESVQLRSFSTEGHRVSTKVMYRFDEDS